MEKKDVLTRLRKHAENMDCGWRERAEWRRKNAAWIRRSQWISVQMLDQMDKLHLTQTALSQRMGCTQQYISKILKGQENLSLETIVKIEEALGIQLFMPSDFVSPVTYDFDTVATPLMVADDSHIE